MYFRFSREISEEVIGPSPEQIEKFDSELPYEFWKDRGPDQLRMPEINNLYLDGYQLHKSAILTDYISGFRGDYYSVFILSDVFIAILKDFSIPDYELLDFGLYRDSSRVYGYKLFRGLWNELDSFIDFKRSVYARFDVARKPLYEVDIDSLNEFKKECKTRRGITAFTAKKVVLKQSFNYDLFSMRSCSGLICSEKFKKRIEYEGLTGIKFEPVENLERLK